MKSGTFVEEKPSQTDVIPASVNATSWLTNEYQQAFNKITLNHVAHYFPDIQAPYTKHLCAYKTIVDFGIGSGEQVKTFIDNEYSIVGYDYITRYAQNLLNKKVKLRFFDLASTQDKHLSYEKELKQDLAQPTNIFLIHTLQYLPEDAVTLLMISLIDLAQKDSIFFIANDVYSRDPKSQLVDYGYLKKNILLSLFKPRKDIELVANEYTKPVTTYNRGEPFHTDKEVLVLRKI